MNFVGTGKRLAQGDVGNAARSIGIETAALLAFMEVEAAGRGFDGRNRPKMLRETHIFYRELGEGVKRNQAVAQGLANRAWVRNYKSDSYHDLQRMIAIDKNAALRSCSWGLPQIMGFNCRDAGFATAELMVLDSMKGEYNQLTQMTKLMAAWGIPRMLQGKDLSNPESWRPVASKYNGAGYAANNYHVRLATSYVKQRGTDMQVPDTGSTRPILRRNSKGEAVWNLQTDLFGLGFVLGIDGRFGPETETQVKAFQSSRGLIPDGVVGRKTWAELDKALETREVVKQPDSPVWEGKEKEPVSLPDQLTISDEGPATPGLFFIAVGLVIIAAVYFIIGA